MSDEEESRVTAVGGKKQRSNASSPVVRATEEEEEGALDPLDELLAKKEIREKSEKKEKNKKEKLRARSQTPPEDELPPPKVTLRTPGDSPVKDKKDKKEKQSKRKGVLSSLPAAEHTVPEQPIKSPQKPLYTRMTKTEEKQFDSEWQELFPISTPSPVVAPMQSYSRYGQQLLPSDDEAIIRRRFEDQSERMRRNEKDERDRRVYLTDTLWMVDDSKTRKKQSTSRSPVVAAPSPAKVTPSSSGSTAVSAPLSSSSTSKKEHKERSHKSDNGAKSSMSDAKADDAHKKRPRERERDQ